MVKIKALKKIYGERTVLDISSLEIKKGETLVVVGPNGSGKTTLLKLLAGVIRNDEGDFSLSGRVAYLPQQSIPFSMTVRKNLLYCVKDKTEGEKRCNEVLELLGLSHLADKSAKGLSGGECQRLALGRVLMKPCDILLLDEPSSAADIEGTDMIENAVRQYKEETHCTVIMTTHSPNQALKLADRIVMLKEGVIAEEGEASELLSSPETPWGKRFISMWKIDI